MASSIGSGSRGRSVRLMIWGIPLRGPRPGRGGLIWTGKDSGGPLDGHLQATCTATCTETQAGRQGERGAGDGADLRRSRVVRYRVLGPLEVTGPDGNPLDVGGAKPRALLTLLLGDAGRVVGVDRIVNALWGDDPPPTVTGTLQAYVSHLRRVLEPERGPREAPKVLLTRAPGYCLQVGADELDLLRFTHLVEEGDRAVAAGDPAGGGALLDGALDLWRGEPLAELVAQPTAGTERLRLTELLVRARERRCDALLAQGRPEAAVPDLQRLVAENPLRERLWA